MQRFAVGKPIVVPRPSPRATRPSIEYRMAEQRPGFVHAALRDQPPDSGAADHEVLVPDRIDLLGLEAVAGAERPQQREVAGAVVAEEEIGADPYLRDVQPVDQRRPDERFRIPPRQIGGEAHDGRPLEAGLRERAELLLDRHQQRRRLVGTDHPRRMRIERHHHRGRAVLIGDAPHAIEDLAMAAVQPVEVPQREHRALPPRGARIVGIVDDLHRGPRAAGVPSQTSSTCPS